MTTSTRTLVLQRGVTGFFNWDERGAIPEFRFGDFKLVIHVVARQLTGSAPNLKERGVTPNFHSALIAFEDQSILILGHSIYPIFAIAKPLEDSSHRLRFIDVDKVSQIVNDHFAHVTLASAQRLAQKLTGTDLAELDEFELEQVKYWKPETVGELVFNWWD